MDLCDWMEGKKSQRGKYFSSLVQLLCLQKSLHFAPLVLNYLFSKFHHQYFYTCLTLILDPITAQFWITDLIYACDPSWFPYHYHPTLTFCMALQTCLDAACLFFTIFACCIALTETGQSISLLEKMHRHFALSIWLESILLIHKSITFPKCACKHHFLPVKFPGIDRIARANF